MTCGGGEDTWDVHMLSQETAGDDSTRRPCGETERGDGHLAEHMGGEVL